MRQLTLRRRPHPAPDRPHDEQPMTPRRAAIRLLREKIDAGTAGLDQYEPADLILIAAENEKVWARRALQLVGVILDASPTDERGIRFRAIIEVDVRDELGLDGDTPPLMETPLASRAVDRTFYPVEVTIASLEERRLRLVDPTPPAMRAAMLEAQHAAALRLDCRCGAPAGLECKCGDADRLASATERQVH